MNDYSKRLRSEAKQYGIPAQSLVLAYLLVCGFTESEAYDIAYTCNASFSKAQNINIRDNIVRNPNFQDIVDRLRKKITGDSKTGKAGPKKTEQLSKDDIAEILKRQMDALPDGDKAKTDAAIKYAELYQYKKDDPKDDNDYLPHIWLPQPCFLCQYKEEYEKNHNKRKTDNGTDDNDKNQQG